MEGNDSWFLNFNSIKNSIIFIITIIIVVIAGIIIIIFILNHIILQSKSCADYTSFETKLGSSTLFFNSGQEVASCQ